MAPVESRAVEVGKLPVTSMPRCPCACVEQMKFWPALLRALLILGLLLSGPGYSVAAAHRGMQPVGQAGSGQVPCHADSPEGMPMAMPQPADEAPPEDASKSAPKSPDCCKSACRCPCTHGTSAAIAPVRVSTGTTGHAPGPQLAETAYASPALPRLIRPPIS